MERIGIEARLAWALLTGEGNNCLQEGGSPYAYEALELMEARELFNLMGRIRETLAARGIDADEDHSGEPTVVHIGKEYDIRIGGIELPLQPLLKTIFIFFLRHPEGICLKDRANYADEISSIYAVISPETSETVREQRMVRLLSPLDNSFSEKLTNLNKRLEEILGKEQSTLYRVQGSNGHPRRIPLGTIYVEWE
jgi:hypothetical protein